MEAIEISVNHESSQGKRHAEDLSCASTSKCTKGSDNQIYHTPQPILINVPQKPTLKFYGCEEEMEKLKSAAESKNNKNYINIAITGQAGVGKTELVLQFIEQNTSNYKNIIWIPSELDNSIRKSILKIVKQLKLVHKKYQLPDIEDIDSLIFLIQKMHRVLSSSNTLIIFDNVLVDIAKYLPPLGIDRNNVTIIITSQYKEWQCDRQITVNCFTPELSFLYLKDNLTPLFESEEKNIPEVSSFLGNNPLALKLFTLYHKYLQNINEIEEIVIPYDINILKLITRIKHEYPCKFLDFKPELLTSDESYPDLKSLHDVTLTSIDNKYGHLENVSKELLIYLSFMKPKNIEAFMLFKLPNIDDRKQIKEAFIILDKYSLITIEKNEIIISPLTQLVVRNSLNEAARLKVIEDLLKCYYSNMEEIIDKNYDLIGIPFRPHIMYLFNNHCTTKIKNMFKYLFLGGSILGNKTEVVSNITKMYNLLYCNYKELQLQRGYLSVLDYNEGYNEVLEQSEKIMSVVSRVELEKDFAGLMILYYRSNALYKTMRYEEAYELCFNIHSLMIAKYGTITYAYESLILLFKIMSELDSDGNSKYFKDCFDIIEKMLKNQVPVHSLSMVDSLRRISSWSSEILELKPIGIIRKHLVKINQEPTVLLELIQNIQKKVELEIKDMTVDDKKKKIQLYLMYQILQCQVTLNDIKNAWNTIKEIHKLNFFYKNKLYTIIMLTFVLAVKIEPKFLSEGLQLSCNAIKILHKNNPDNKLDFTMKCIKVIENNLSEDLVCKFYAALHSLYNKVDVHCLMLYEARYLLTCENVDKAWSIYEKVCSERKREVENKPYSLKLMLDFVNKLLNDLERESDITKRRLI